MKQITESYVKSNISIPGFSVLPSPLLMTTPMLSTGRLVRCYYTWGPCLGSELSPEHLFKLTLSKGGEWEHGYVFVTS
jgi:hypothetical protein